ncbi:MAG TPA: helix-turn-helix domain-containing protein [Pyrinomonadaceae bacterium]|nr:helix-turn-helix domain-containing protein [Pyrinomonadaceae bacterium]
MEAMSVLNERRHYGGTHAEARRLFDEQATSLSRIEMLEELTLTLLKEIALLKDIQKLQGQDDEQSLSLPDEVRRFEIEIIRRTLMRTGGHQARAAHLLGVNATTLNSKLKRYQIDPNPPFRTEAAPRTLGEAGGMGGS